jgi:predicted TPR repeat methyltransferase
MTEHQRWVVTTTQERPIQDVARDLRDRGFKITETLDMIGCITGTAGADLIKIVRKIEGIADISADTNINLPPADEDLTW